MTTQKNDDKEISKEKTQSGYQTPIDTELRHTGMYEESDSEDDARPEAGSSNTLKEGAPNQGTERR
jgi:hypothetical protein